MKLMKLNRFGSLLLAALLLLAVLGGCAGKNGPSSDEPETPTESQSADPQPTETQSGGDEYAALEGIHVGSGLMLEGLSAATGSFPEDGSDTYAENMMAAIFTNHGEATLQYARVLVTVDGTVYTFEISTLPVGKSVCAFDLDMQTAPEQVESVTAEAEYMAFFGEEPSTEADCLQVTFSDGSISVKNISGAAINQEISVYYKTAVDGVYMGGITYRVRVGTLAAGQEVIGQSSHAGEQSELMFITYEN